MLAAVPAAVATVYTIFGVLCLPHFLSVPIVEVFLFFFISIFVSIWQIVVFDHCYQKKRWRFRIKQIDEFESCLKFEYIVLFSCKSINRTVVIGYAVKVCSL